MVDTKSRDYLNLSRLSECGYSELFLAPSFNLHLNDTFIFI